MTGHWLPMGELLELTVGDMVTVNGQTFILVEFKQEINKPSQLIFKQPIELMEKKEI